MTKRTDVEVIINDKRYTLGGYESEEYLQKVASYINAKYAEFKSKDFYRSLDFDMKMVLMQINLADDYFKMVDHLKEITDESNQKSNEIFDLKHDLIQMQNEYEAAEKEIERLKSENLEQQKEMIRLEAELKGVAKKQGKARR
ncbi:MAG: cell division protein ZapA [Lachnospiraceae bacterium]|nr:cell division protein ZapA [Lachnospiraceae bacterium]